MHGAIALLDAFLKIPGVSRPLVFYLILLLRYLSAVEKQTPAVSQPTQRACKNFPKSTTTCSNAQHGYQTGNLAMLAWRSIQSSYALLNSNKKFFKYPCNQSMFQVLTLICNIYISFTTLLRN